MAEYRIKSFDGISVTFSYNDHSTKQCLYTTITVEEFISKLIRHIPDQNFRNIRHSGIFANRVRTKLLSKARFILNQTPRHKPVPLSFQQRYKKTFNIDPLACNNCGTPMVLSAVVIVHTKTVRERVENKHQELIENYRLKRSEGKTGWQTSLHKSQLVILSVPSANGLKRFLQVSCCLFTLLMMVFSCFPPRFSSQFCQILL